MKVGRSKEVNNSFCRLFWTDRESIRDEYPKGIQPFGYLSLLLQSDSANCEPLETKQNKETFLLDKNLVR